jgi:hypothetical protein
VMPITTKHIDIVIKMMVNSYNDWNELIILVLGMMFTILLRIIVCIRYIPKE